MKSVGQKVFGRGCWKSGEEHWAEMGMLNLKECIQLTDGIIKDEDGLMNTLCHG